MPHPPILRGIQMVINALQNAGHTVVEWQPYKHNYGVSLARQVLSADGGAAIKAALTSSDEPVVPNLAAEFSVPLEIIDLLSFWKIQNEKYTYQKEYLALWQQRSHVDGWILPVAPHAAVKHNDYKYYGYSTVINLLDWPAVTVPVTFADKNKDIKDIQYKTRNELDRIVYESYDADIYEGAPVGIQIIGKRLQEEYLLGLAEQIGEALKNSTT